jgi:hypothetical protein
MRMTSPSAVKISENASWTPCQMSFNVCLVESD